MQSYADALLYQNDGQVATVKQEAGPSSAEAGQGNQAPTSSTGQEGGGPHAAASAAPPASTPPATAAQQQVDANRSAIRSVAVPLCMTFLDSVS